MITGLFMNTPEVLVIPDTREKNKRDGILRRDKIVVLGS